MGSLNIDPARYSRQMLFHGIGDDGQRALAAARAAVIGVGATGSVLANHLVRAGIGFLRLVDRDRVELSNLPRQLLYDEGDVAAALPKAVAAERKLQAINSGIAIQAVVADVTAQNIEALVADVDVVLDGTDNFLTRYLINDVCVKLGKPWVYTGVVAAYGMSMTIVPGVTACLRCAMGEMPRPEDVPGNAVLGVVGPIVSVLGSISAFEAIKLLIGRGKLNPGLIHVDLWENTFEQFDLGGPVPGCPACAEHNYAFLRGEA